jgi:hypothetical protein
VILERIVGRFATAKRLALIQQRLPEVQPSRGRRRRDSTPCHSMLSNPYFVTVLAPLLEAVRVAKAA